MRSFIKTPYLIIALLLSSIGYIFSCTHDNDILVSTGPKITRGTAVHSPGAMTPGNPAEWKLDKSHSSVLWSTTYVGASGLLTGRFNQFGMGDITAEKALMYTATGQPVKDLDWAFNEADPTKTFFNGYVQINTSNTGEPGRDAGCNVGAMGTVAIVAGQQNLTPTNLAKIKTTKVELDPASNGYIVTMDLTYKGTLTTPLTKSVIGKMTYIPQKKVQFGTSAAYEVFGLQLKFQFNCRDFGIASTSISDLIQIECNMNFNNK